MSMKGFEETSEGFFHLSFKSPLQPINYRFLLPKTRSETTSDAKNRVHFEKIRPLILLVEPFVNIQKMNVPAKKNLLFHYK